MNAYQYFSECNSSVKKKYDALRDFYFLGHKAADVAKFWLLTIGIAVLLIGTTLAFFIARGIITSLKRVINDLTVGSDQVASASSQVSAASQSLAEGSTEQAAGLEETSSSLEETSARRISLSPLPG